MIDLTPDQPPAMPTPDQLTQHGEEQLAHDRSLIVRSVLATALKIVGNGGGAAIPARIVLHPRIELEFDDLPRGEGPTIQPWLVEFSVRSHTEGGNARGTWTVYHGSAPQFPYPPVDLVSFHPPVVCSGCGRP
jgi:hypothetical protein